MKLLLKKTMAIITVLVLTLTLSGCEADDDNLPEVFAGFTHTIIANTGTVTFINTSSDVKYYLWDFGDGTTATEINPVKTYVNGTYTVILKITNVAGAAATYEDIIIIGGVSNGAVCTAETVESISAASFNMTFKSDQTTNIVSDGANFAWVVNPKSDNGLNPSCKVGKVTKTGTNPWDNIQINLDSKLDFTTHSGFKIKVFSAVPGFKVLLKLEDKANAGTNTELEATTTKTNEWEELSFPFPGTASNKYNKIVLIFDLATKNTNTYYFDDLALYGTGSGGGTGGGATCTAETAESLSASSLNITFKSDQTANVINDGANFSWVANPDANNAVNSSCYVGKITKLGNNPWDNNQINLSAKLDFNANAGLKIKVYSAKAGFKVRIKLEEIGNAGNNTELEVTSTKTNAWEELTFPFASTDSGKFNKIVMFFDLNANNKDIYYFDDLKVYERTGGGGGTGGTPATGDIAVNGGFETGDFTGWALYKNGGVIEVDNTQSKTGTYSAKLFASPSGLNPTLKQERKGAGGIKVGDKVKITFDYRGSLAGISGAYSIQSFVEAANGVNQVVNIAVAPTATWQNFTTTYTVAAGDVSGGITLEFVAICGGVQGCSSTLYIDNVSIIINP